MCCFTATLSFSLLVKEFLNGKRLAKIRTKWLIVSCAPFALCLFHQRCRTRKISRITCVWRRETVRPTNCCYVNTQIYLTLFSTDIKLLKTIFNLLTDRFTPPKSPKLCEGFLRPNILNTRKSSSVHTKTSNRLLYVDHYSGRF